MQIQRQGLTVIGLIVLGVGCGGGKQHVRPDDMSAQAHLQEADKAAAAARAEEAHANSPAMQPNMAVSANSNPQGYFYPPDMYDPRTQHLVRAKQLSRHARQHEAAAAHLESFEQAECKEFPSATRAACPLLGPLTEIADVAGGVRVTFAAGTRVDAVVEHMRCHFAYAQSRGFETGAGCPLYIRGIQIRATSDPRAVEIVGRDATVASEIRNRSREEAVWVHGSYVK